MHALGSGQRRSALLLLFAPDLETGVRDVGEGHLCAHLVALLSDPRGLGLPVECLLSKLNVRVSSLASHRLTSWSDSGGHGFSLTRIFVDRPRFQDSSFVQ